MHVSTKRYVNWSFDVAVKFFFFFSTFSTSGFRLQQRRNLYRRFDLQSLWIMRLSKKRNGGRKGSMHHWVRRKSSTSKLKLKKKTTEKLFFNSIYPLLIFSPLLAFIIYILFFIFYIFLFFYFFSKTGLMWIFSVFCMIFGIILIFFSFFLDFFLFFLDFFLFLSCTGPSLRNWGHLHWRFGLSKFHVSMPKRANYNW